MIEGPQILGNRVKWLFSRIERGSYKYVVLVWLNINVETLELFFFLCVGTYSMCAVVTYLLKRTNHFVFLILIFYYLFSLDVCWPMEQDRYVWKSFLSLQHT